MLLYLPLLLAELSDNYVGKPGQHKGNRYTNGKFQNLEDSKTIESDIEKTAMAAGISNNLIFASPSLLPDSPDSSSRSTQAPIRHLSS